jgi:hypothetical protein
LRESRILRASRQVLSVLAGVDRFHAARPRRPDGARPTDSSSDPQGRSYLSKSKEFQGGALASSYGVRPSGLPGQRPDHSDR